MKALGLICLIAGFLLAILAGVVWWPGLDEFEWPGLIPVATILGSGVLILVGYRLWTGRDLPPL
jgi:hypothetical protein